MSLLTFPPFIIYYYVFYYIIDRNRENYYCVKASLVSASKVHVLDSWVVSPLVPHFPLPKLSPRLAEQSEEEEEQLLDPGEGPRPHLHLRH